MYQERKKSSIITANLVHFLMDFVDTFDPLNNLNLFQPKKQARNINV